MPVEKQGPEDRFLSSDGKPSRAQGQLGIQFQGTRHVPDPSVFYRVHSEGASAASSGPTWAQCWGTLCSSDQSERPHASGKQACSPSGIQQHSRWSVHRGGKGRERRMTWVWFATALGGGERNR